VGRLSRKILAGKCRFAALILVLGSIKKMNWTIACSGI
jgi:hypothetical protein